MTNYSVPATQSFNTPPDEDSMTANIIAQVQEFAKERGLYTNVAKITEYSTNKFTKYGLFSRPDVSSYISGVISTEDHTRTV